MHIVKVTATGGKITEAQWLARAETVHRQLRPQLPTDYGRRMAEIFATGVEMWIAVEGERVLGVAVFRMIENTSAGRKLYVDDLVSDETQRSQGVGKLLLDGLTEEARQRGCQTFDLDSGTQRTDAHRFYFRERMVVKVFGFTKPLTSS
jgi:L-amino acid N-acyltransferase YncA